MGVSWQKLVVLAAATVFAVFLVWKNRPRFAAGHVKRRGHVSRDEVRAAREKARLATTPRERATALVAAASAAAMDAQGLTGAMGLYLRAMRTDPTFCEPIVAIAALLRKERPELLEAVLWRRLNHLEWTGNTREAVRCAAAALVALYRNELPHRDRAGAMEKIAASLKG